MNELFSNGLAYAGTGVLGVMFGVMFRMLIVADRRATAEIKRINADHDNELTELRTARKDENTRLEGKIVLLTAQVEALNDRFDEERNARRRAEDQAAELIRQFGGPRAAS